MGEDVFCGIKVSGRKERPCGVAFLSERLETFSETDDGRVLELIEEREPKVVAFSTPLKRVKPGTEFSEEEEELVKEGRRFLPRGMMNKDETERAIFLRDSVKRLTFIPQMIECRPEVTAQVLGIEGDEDLERLGVPAEEIHNTAEFDAVLAAVTAKFYANDRFEEKGFIVPKKLD